MTTMLILICVNMATCTVETATHSWYRPASSRACITFKGIVESRGGDVGQHLNLYKYEMQPGERVKVVCEEKTP